MTTPRPVSRSLTDLGTSVRGWRVLLGLSQQVTADRAGVSLSTLKRLEAGDGASLEAYLRVARAIGILDAVTQAADPLMSDVGRMRADELIGSRRTARR